MHDLEAHAQAATGRADERLDGDGGFGFACLGRGRDNGCADDEEDDPEGRADSAQDERCGWGRTSLALFHTCKQADANSCSNDPKRQNHTARDHQAEVVVVLRRGFEPDFRHAPLGDSGFRFLAVSEIVLHLDSVGAWGEARYLKGSRSTLPT